MEPNTFYIIVNESDYILKYVNLLNGVGRLTDMEMKVLAVFIKYGIVNQSTREAAVIELGLKSTSNINNYIKSLKDKKILLRDKEDYLINPKYIPNKEGLNFKFVWDTPSIQ